MTPLEQKASSLNQQLKGDRNIQSIGIAEKGQYNPEDYICIYTKKPFKPGTYPEIFEGVKVKTMHIGKVEIRRSADGGI